MNIIIKNKSYCAFHENIFLKFIDKYLDFSYIPLKVYYKNIKYYITLFKNETEGIFQIGAVGYGCIFPHPEKYIDFVNIINLIEEKISDKIEKVTFAPDLENIIKTWDFDDSMSVKELNTQILDLSKYRKKGSSIFKDSVRTDIRYAYKNGVEISTCDSNEDLVNFYCIYQETMKRVNAGYCSPYNFIKELIFNSNIAKLYLAKYNSKVIAGCIFLKANNNLFYWINAQDYEMRRLRPNYLILSNFIKDNKNCDYINFGYSHYESLYKAKASWGCEDVKYYQFIKK